MKGRSHTLAFGICYWRWKEFISKRMSRTNTWKTVIKDWFHDRWIKVEVLSHRLTQCRMDRWICACRWNQRWCKKCWPISIQTMAKLLECLASFFFSMNSRRLDYFSSYKIFTIFGSVSPSRVHSLSFTQFSMHFIFFFHLRYVIYFGTDHKLRDWN